MRPFHHATPASTLVPLVLLGMATAAPAQQCTWETMYDGIHTIYEDLQGTGIAMADVDGDGDADMIAASLGIASVLITNGAADPTLLQFETLGYSFGTAAGDFDGDGHVDVAFGLLWGGAAIHLGFGDGTFSPGVFLDFGTGTSITDIVAVDTNHDGALDIVLTDPAGSIGVLRGGGDGTFAPALVYATGAKCTSITVLDIDGDGSVDLITANTASDDISVLINLGDGTYAPALNIAVGNEPSDVATGDFDGDGITDLAVAEESNSAISTISTFVGAGDGTFAPGATIQVAGGAFFLSAIDLDGDAYTDLVATGWGARHHSVVSLFIGSTGAGDPGLATGATYSHFPHGSHAVIDMNSDGVDDVVVYGAGYDVYEGHGDGTLDALPAVPIGGYASAAADMNGDGIVDLLATDDVNSFALRVALGRGDGTFDVPMVTLLDSLSSGFAVGDIDDDGDLDVVVAESLGVARVLRNAGDGTLTITESYGTYALPEAVELADLDEDGTLDLLVVHQILKFVGIRLGLGDGTFGTGSFAMLGNRNLAVVDLDGDGHLDLLGTERISNEESIMSRCLGNGDGTFSPRETFATPHGYIGAIKAGDIDGDGIVDVLLGGGAPPCLSVYRGTGTGFDPAEVYIVPGGEFAYPEELVIDDFDGDGVLDVAMSLGSSLAIECRTFVFRGTCDGVFETPTCVRSPRSAFSIVAADFDGNGAVDLAVTSSDRTTTLHLNTCAGETCPADIDGSGDVGFADLLSVLAAWGTCAGCPEDLDGNGDVGFADLLAVLAAWGACA